MPLRALALRCGIAALAVISTYAMAQDKSSGTRVSPGGTTRVFVMAGFDADCRSLGKPQITVTAPPAKGTVSFREGQTTTVQYSLSGKCIGTKVQGTGIYYTANANAAGPDQFAIEARLGSGEVASRSFRLNISD